MAGKTCDGHVVPGVLRVTRERLALEPREVEDLAEPVLPAATDDPTVSAGSAASRVSETMSAGAASGRMSIRLPCVRPLST